MRLPDVANMLRQTYWADGRTELTIARSMEHSICFGAFEKSTGRQIGFARAVTDYATVWYLCDVTVDRDFRGRGVGRAIMDAVGGCAELVGLDGILTTTYARGFYLPYGFQNEKSIFMEKKGLAQFF